ncbi:YeeE/YedE family protein [Aquimarina sp. AD10]|uniref:YeeE/YedE family protein n=1 Tax=Aquimarina aggregata TaxID=1642818 RepID=A0A162ZT71_9FLAO|nr:MULTISPECIES: YeeE/YedE thiosulfate transporter family protein [Aquimarina]AXT62329.1 YeeE/YedE family protein [Aquimarina sp. AD10]KZS40013.1 YeeE/YedE family protein [Aquimarina aggregata]RKM90475.1 YeeE/YedE family protein [Aquimarina sp. AD10]
MNWIFDPWPWYISGPLIVLVMFALLITGKQFGMSSNLRTMCTMCGAGKAADFFRFDWKAQRWNLIVAIGTIIGGYIGANFLTKDAAVDLHPEVISKLQNQGFKSAGEAYLPNELFANAIFSDPSQLIFLIIGGLLVGFGARYAGGCTSGHAISGLSNLQIPSLIAVIGFFIGGLLMIHFIFPLIF